MMAAQTDGEAMLNTNDVGGAMKKVFADVGSYYLLSYYSTNQKLDGRFRRIRVEVKRQDVDVRSRPGYLAPTEAEARAAGVAIDRARREARAAADRDTRARCAGAGTRQPAGACAGGRRPQAPSARSSSSMPPRPSNPNGSRAARCG